MDIFDSLGGNTTNLHRFDPTSREYIKKLGLLAVPGAVLSGLSVLILIFFLFFRLVVRSHAFGANRWNRHASPESFGRYTRRQVHATKAGLLAVAVVLGLCVLQGAIGSQRISKGVAALSDRYVVRVAEGKDVVALLKKLAVAGGDAEMSKKIDQVNAKVETINSNAAKVKASAIRLDRVRHRVVIGLLSFPLVGFASSFLSAVLSRGYFSWLTIISCFLSLTANWVSFGLHVSVDRALQDMCADIKVFLTEPPKYRISSIVQCVPVQPIDEARISIVAALKKIQDTQNSMIDMIPPFYMEFLKIERLDLPLKTLNSTGPKLAVELAVAETEAKLNKTELSIAEIPDSIFSQKSEVTDGFSRAKLGASTLPGLIDLRDCVFVAGAVRDVNVSACKTIKSAVVLVCAALGLCAVALIPGVVLAIISVHRFTVEKFKDDAPRNETEMGNLVENQPQEANEGEVKVSIWPEQLLNEVE
jgi:hypothetical protein